ncbi:MAG: undecaprenyl diphosphate synthase family protein, partial [Candidatus Liptonbacteria bacterium]|nr:undecaprenyl diphosphate synthase family protein [Candidatus Liptonbacteria bacterium]
MPIPNHVAIIPDGNRRWAKKRGLPSFFGHREGAKTTEKILKTALDLEIPHITFWGSSVSNVTERSKPEVAYLLKLFEINFKKLTKNKLVHENGVRVNVLGRWEELFPEGLKKAIREVIKKTAGYNNFQLTFLMAYSGVDEMADAISRLRQGYGGQAKIKNPAFTKVSAGRQKSK